MTTIRFHGKDYKCFEHMSEVKESKRRRWVLGRYYNKKQMLKALIGKETKGELGTKLCHKVHTGETDYLLEIYKLQNLSTRKYDWVEESLELGDSFFLKDDEGQIYFFYLQID